MARYIDFEYEKNNSSIKIKKYCGSAKFVNIPSQIENLPVTEIGVNAFYGCNSLTGVTIPDSVKEIDWGAFDSCRSLKNITIPNSAIKISPEAFWNCDVSITFTK